MSTYYRKIGGWILSRVKTLQNNTIFPRNLPHGRFGGCAILDSEKMKRRITMAQFVKLDPEALRELHVGNERLVSYNVEMT